MDEDTEELPTEQFGHPRIRTEVTWASCIRIVDGLLCDTKQLFEFDEGEAAFRYISYLIFMQSYSPPFKSVCVCYFSSQPQEIFVVVGTGENVQVNGAGPHRGYLRTYRLAGDGELSLVHKVGQICLTNDGVLTLCFQTEIEGIPTSLCPFQGRVLVGADNALRVYDIGKKKMLRKCECKVHDQSLYKPLVSPLLLDVTQSHRLYSHTRQPHRCWRHSRLGLLRALSPSRQSHRCVCG